MHHHVVCFLAQGSSAPLLPDAPRASSLHQWLGNPQFLLVAGLVVALTAVLFIWALVIRKRRPTDPHLRALEPGGVSAASSNGGHRHRRHRRRRRSDGSREHRNPTLQETGGLPPPRPENELPRM